MYRWQVACGDFRAGEFGIVMLCLYKRKEKKRKRRGEKVGAERRRKHSARMTRGASYASRER